MNKINAVCGLFLSGVLIQVLQILINQKNAKDLVNSVLTNYHLIVKKISVLICAQEIVVILRIVLMKKLMVLGTQQYVKM